MTRFFVEDMNELIYEATLDASDEEILAEFDLSDPLRKFQLRRIENIIVEYITKSRNARLRSVKESFHKSKQQRISERQAMLAGKNITEMLVDIINVIGKNEGKVPKGVLLAFREQGEEGSEEDIKKIWEDLVDLGLIDPDEEV